MLRTLLILAGGALALVLAVVLLAWRYQERIVWQPPAGLGPYAPASELAVRVASYEAADGQALHGYLVGAPADVAPDRVLIAFHGNAETAGLSVPWALRVARETGWAVFLPEYRGYAGLPGVPTYEGSQQDARAAHAWVRDTLGVPGDRIALAGFSLGTAVATELAAEVQPPVLLLQAPFTSARDMARIAGTWPVGLAWGAIARVHFDTRSRVAALDVPVWVVHGDRDRVIPVRMGRAVHAAARRPGGYVEIPGAGHDDLVTTGGAAYWGWVREALGVGE